MKTPRAETYLQVRINAIQTVATLCCNFSDTRSYLDTYNTLCEKNCRWNGEGWTPI